MTPPPEAELTSTQEAIQKAESSEAAKYSSTKFSEAKSTLDSALQEMEKQKKKLFAKYANTVSLLQQAKKLSEESILESGEVKTQLINEINTILQNDTLIYNEVNQLLGDARLKNMNVDAITPSLDSAVQFFSQAKTALSEGSLEQAKNIAIHARVLLEMCKEQVAALSSPVDAKKSKK